MRTIYMIFLVASLFGCVTAPGNIRAAAMPDGMSEIEEQGLGSHELKWRLVGPYRGGRVNAVVGHPTKPAVFFAGYTGGGVWRTGDAGTTWQNISDGHFNLGSIGAMDIARSDPDVLYVGTGEHALRGDVSHGDGVYKSIDGGETWINVGLKNTRQISKLIVHRC